MSSTEETAGTKVVTVGSLQVGDVLPSADGLIHRVARLTPSAAPQHPGVAYLGEIRVEVAWTTPEGEVTATRSASLRPEARVRIVMEVPS
jgi:hypothetical protein